MRLELGQRVQSPFGFGCITGVGGDPRNDTFGYYLVRHDAPDATSGVFFMWLAGAVLQPTGAMQAAVEAEGNAEMEHAAPTPLFPEDAAARKEYPVFTGLLMYFPRACAAVAHVSYLGNQQHSPGQPLQWVRGKSADQDDANLRHMMEHASGKTHDVAGYCTKAQAAWRALAELELFLEREAEVTK